VIKVNTTRFGEIEVNDADVIKLPAGLIGFPEYKQYVLLDHDKESPFKWLQSLDEGAIAFVVIDPRLFRPDYTVEVTQAEVTDLALDNEDDAVVSVIITMPSNPQNMTANLKAPLIFNLKNRTGKQIILNNPAYTTRHNVMEEMRKRSEQAAQERVQQATKDAKDAQTAASREVANK
jgi:flagellar assembly factor FliW